MALNEFELASAELPLHAADNPTVGSRDLPSSTRQASRWQEPTLNFQPVDVQMAQRDFWRYMKDVGERSILFLDTLRQWADNMLAHDRAGKLPLLDFDYEIILDAGHFKPQTNYSLLRITRVGGDCLADCVDSTKPRSSSSTRAPDMVPGSVVSSATPKLVWRSARVTQFTSWHSHPSRSWARP